MSPLLKNLFANIIFRIALGAVLVVGGIAYVATRGGPDARATARVTRGTIIEEVSLTGSTKPAEEASLAFERGGRVVGVHAKVGDTIARGGAILSLDASELAAQRKQADANLAAQTAKLDELKRGARPEEIQIKQTELLKAEQDFANAYANSSDVSADAYNDAEVAVRKTIDDLFTNDESYNVQLSFTTADSQKAIDTQTGRIKAGSELNSWKTELNGISSASSHASLDALLVRSIDRLTVIRIFLNDLVDATVNASGISTSSLTSYKSAATTARSSVNDALANVNAQIQKIASQSITVRQLNDQLALTLAGADPQQIAAQEAQVAQMEASVAQIDAQISKTVLRSPIKGIVTKQNGKLGEIVVATTPIAAVISEQKLEIEANVAEADVAKVRVGNPARITFDAFGESVKFLGAVAAIDPAETLVDGVPTYTINIQLDELHPAIKPGLTANIDLTTNRRENVLMIPQRAIIYREDKKFVSVVRGDGTEEREVTTGIRGSDGMIEVLSGLSEGETILQ